MLVQVRDGSTVRNLDAILPALVAGQLGDFWTLVTDDVFPTDLRDHGHIDGLLRRVVAAGVAPALRETLAGRVAAIRERGTTVLLIEHDMEMVARLCSRVLVMAGGRLLAQGTPAEIARHPEVVEAEHPQDNSEPLAGALGAPDLGEGGSR